VQAFNYKFARFQAAAHLTSESSQFQTSKLRDEVLLEAFLLFSGF
jgi:hypothetical protein